MSKKKAANWKSATTNGFFAVYIVPKSIGIALFPIGIDPVPIGITPIPIGIETIQIEITLFPIGIKAILIEKGLMSIGSGAIPVNFEPIPTGIGVIPIRNGLIPIGIRAIPMCIRPVPACSGAGTTVVYSKQIYSRAYLRCRQAKKTGTQKRRTFFWDRWVLNADYDVIWLRSSLLCLVANCTRRRRNQ
ncbi:hypothetical protein [Candidatus Electronema sp. PJ]|uniref:hypothetical protein n=1 Tax=Candidatus Electronema sp. PJ TaxID=3401572 RepID=UPI003AA7E296